MLHMEQKDYKLEIVNVLSKGEAHIREIAKILSINHMMVVRKIKELLNQNVVDFNLEGKNQVYFLKKTVEARNYFLMAENYNLTNLVLKYPFLREFVLKVQNDKRLKLAFVFGSYSKGNENKNSDVDIYFDSENLDVKKDYSKLDSKFSIKLGKWDKNNFLIKEIIKNHVLIKGGEIYYEKIFG